jgi:hypothetical protein
MGMAPYPEKMVDFGICALIGSVAGPTFAAWRKVGFWYGLAFGVACTLVLFLCTLVWKRFTDG